MHRFRLILLPLCLFATATAIGQTVTGRIVDERQQPVAGVAVVMQTPDSVYVDAVASDLEGRFAIASGVRPYRLLFQHLSYDPLTVERSGDDAGTVTLTEATNLVDEVVVRGERPLVKVEQGRLSYDLQVAAQGKIAANAYEALTKLPGVSERDGALTLAGAAGVTVILNGKPSTMTAEQLAALLKSTPVEQVEKVEVLYAAPPQYHIRGAAINVVLRRRFGRSFSGQVNGTYEGGYYHSWGTGASAVYSTPTLSVDALYRVGEARSMRKLPLTSQHTVGSDTFDIRQEQRLADDNLTHNLRTGLSWKTSEKSHIDLAYTASFTPSGKGDISATGNYVASDSHIRDDAAMHNLALSASTGFGMQIGADYTHYNTTSRQEMSLLPADGAPSSFRTDAGQCIDRLSLSLDQNHDLGRQWTLDYGARFVYVRDNDYQYYTSEEAMSDRDTDLRLDEYTYDLYAGTSRNFASGVSFSASLTGEYYRRNGYDRWAFFPQASLSWMASADHILQAEFSSDKSYPSFWDMSGAVTYLDGYAEVHGTPGLRPSSNYGLTLTYVLKQKYIFQLFGNHRVDAFTQSAYLSPDRPALIYQTLNWDYMSSFGALAVVPLRIGERFTSRITLSGFDYLLRNRDFYGMDYKRSKWVGYAALDNTLRLSRKPDLAFEFGGYYQSEAIQCTYGIGASWRLDAGVKWTFAAGKAELSVKGNDLFDSMTPVSKVDFGEQRLRMGNDFHTRNVTVNFVYRFGGYKDREHKKVDTSRFRH